MSEQQDLFFTPAGEDTSKPLPDEDLEATGYHGPEIKPVNRPAPERNSGTQGKCRHCKECFRWHSRRPLRMAYCPQCGEKLEGTTYSNHWPWNIGVEPLTAVQAWAKFKR